MRIFAPQSEDISYKLMNMKSVSILFLAVAAAGMLACAGNTVTYEVTGNNAPEDGVTVYLVDRLTASPIDSAVVADGCIKMKGKAEKDAFMAVNVSGSDWSYLLFNDGVPVQVNFADSMLTGSALNNKLTECDLRSSDAYAVFNRFITDFLALPKAEQEAREAEFTEQYVQQLHDFGQVRLDIIEENMDNLIPVAFMDGIAELFGYEKVNELMATDAPFTRHPFVLDLKRGLDEAMAAEKEADDSKQAFVGKKFIDFEEADPDGKMHKLSEYVGQGKWVLVDFWASWCGPCKAEMPNVVAAYKQYHDKGFEVVGISFDREKEPWVKAIVEWGMPWIHLSDLKYWNNAASDLYGIDAIPDNLLIDPKGIVVARGLRGPALKDRLAEIFQ